MSLRVHHLSCGSFCPHLKGSLAFPTAHLCCHCLVIETEEGLVLVDTGIPEAELKMRADWIKNLVTHPDRSDANSMKTQLKDLGFNPRDVRHIVMTHLDWDHAGGLHDFPQATVHMHHAEADYIHGESKMLRYDDRLWSVDTKVESYARFGENWKGFKAVRPLRGLPPEILLVPLLGHSPGHSGVAVESDHGTLFHAGDSFFFEEDLGLNIFRRNKVSDLLQTLLAVQNTRRLATLWKIRQFQGAYPDVRVFNSHDPRLFEAAAGA